MIRRLRERIADWWYDWVTIPGDDGTDDLELEDEVARLKRDQRFRDFMEGT